MASDRILVVCLERGFRVQQVQAAFAGIDVDVATYGCALTGRQYARLILLDHAAACEHWSSDRVQCWVEVAKQRLGSDQNVCLL